MSLTIIRAVWGVEEYLWKEIPTKPLFDKEIVMVWGVDTEQRLKDMGYKTILVSKIPTLPEFSTLYNHFVHKLIAIEIAENSYDEFLFLDWDVNIVKPVDEQFWNLIKSGNNVQCPLYAYPLNYEEKALNYIKQNPQKQWVQELDPNTYTWLNVQNQFLEKYNWQWKEYQVVPNFCFFYSRGVKYATKLIEIYREHGIKTCVEEFCMQIAADCTLEEYIHKFEPLVINGRPDEYHHFDLVEGTSKYLNEYIGEHINKTIYLTHI